MSDVRQATMAMLEMCESSGDYEWLARACLEWMSEKEVADMADHYDWLEEVE